MQLVTLKTPTTATATATANATHGIVERAKTLIADNANKIAVGTTAVLLLPAAQAAEGGTNIDTTGILSSISGLSSPVQAVGTAILGIAALIFGFKLIKRFF